MAMLRRLLSRATEMWSGTLRERDINDEIAFHLSEEADERAACGLERHQAEQAARRDFGNVLKVREQTRAVWNWGALERLVLDARHAARGLVRSPGFTIPAVLTLGLGVGATTAMFSAVNAVVLNELPYTSAERIVVLRQVDAKSQAVMGGVSAANLQDVATRARTLSIVAGVEGPHGLRWIDQGRALTLRAWLATEGFFEAMGTSVVLGRGFLPSEFVAGNERVVVLSHRAWQKHFGGDETIVGRDLVLDGAKHTVVGVLPADFVYPSIADVWAPRPLWDDDDASRTILGMDAVARLKPGATIAEARTELEHIAKELAATYPTANANLNLRAVPLKEHVVGDVELPLLLLLGAVGLVLLIAAANVAGLQLARGAAKSREYALRSALGGGAWRILRFVAIESICLAVAGAVLGMGLAYLGIDAIRGIAPDGVPRIDEVRLDGRVLWFGVGVAWLSAIVAGLPPALRIWRLDLRAALTDGSRGSTDSVRVGRVRDHLVMAEIAVAVTLTIGAGLMVRSFDRLLRNDLGFVPENKLAVQVWAFDDDHRVPANFFEGMRERLRGIAGVELVGLTTDLPLADDRSLLARSVPVSVTLDSRSTAAAPASVTAGLAAIDEGYLSVMGIALRAGRAFLTQDHAKSRPVALVNETFARRYLTGDAVGRVLTVRGRGQFTVEIVGVVSDVRRQGFQSAPGPEVYVPLTQRPSNGLTFVVKTPGDPASMVSAVERAMWAIDSRQAIWAARPLPELLAGWTQQRRFNTVMLVSFALFALGLSAVGVYAIMSFVVGQRVAELGIRRALGGNDRDILWLVLGRAIRLALAGAAIGLVGSAALTRGLRGMLYEIHPLDPLTFGVVAVVVVAVGLLSAWLPARRAIRINPIAALRSD